MRRSVVAELEPLSRQGRGLSSLLSKRLSLARAFLNPAIPPQTTAQAQAQQREPPPTLDQLSFRLIQAGRSSEALSLLEHRLQDDRPGAPPIPEPLASRSGLQRRLGSGGWRRDYPQRCAVTSTNSWLIVASAIAYRPSPALLLDQLPRANG